MNKGADIQLFQIFRFWNREFVVRAETVSGVWNDHHDDFCEVAWQVYETHGSYVIHDCVSTI